MVLVHVLAVGAMLCASIPSASAFYGAPLDYLNACEGASSPPSGFTDAGLPIGIQLIGRHRGELALLRLAHAINGATGLPDRTPPL